MASLKDRTGCGDSSQSLHDVEFLPLVADVWVGSGCLSAQSASSFSLGRAWQLCSGITRQLPWRLLVLDQSRRQR
jgi:hypothetical protein